jgi:hypothetical protein
MEVLSKTIDDIPMSVLMKGLHLWSLTNTFCTILVILSLSVLAIQITDHIKYQEIKVMA